MKPEELAVNHSKITDKQLAALHLLFTSVRSEVEKDTVNLMQQLKVNTDGVCENCKENKQVINSALTLVSNKLRKSRPQIKAIYGEGVTQIEFVAHEYVNWLRNG